MSARHFTLPPGRGYTVLALTLSEVRALHALAQAALHDEAAAAKRFGGPGGQSQTDAGKRAVEILAAARQATNGEG